MEFTLRSLLNNPTGDNTAYVAARYQVKEALDNKYFNLLKVHGKFPIKCYLDKDDYYFHIKIPSEKVNSIYYDVVLKVSPPTNEIKEERNIQNYTINMFCNASSFVYTYAYVINKNKLLIDFLTNKYDQITLTQAPSVKNPVESFGFEKNIYIACKYIFELGLTSKFNIEQSMFKFSKTAIISDVKSFAQVDQLYKTEKAKNKKTKSKSKI